jgi:hypothetical protein
MAAAHELDAATGSFPLRKRPLLFPEWFGVCEDRRFRRPVAERGCS